MHVPGFQLRRELARGGMGVVWEAWSERLQRTVALKLVRPDLPLDLLGRERLRREVAAMARVRHENVVPVLDTGEHEGRPWLAMELIEGESLRERLQRDGPLSGRDAARIARSLADALAAAHAVGVLHRDLKPGNVLLDAAGRPLLIDFGLARIAEGPTSLTATGMTVGTPAYMAPEQASGLPEAVGPHTDVYGLGALLYELLTGRQPFAGGAALDIMLRVQVEAPVSPRRVRSGIDRALEAIVLRCLAKKPEARPSGAATLRDELEAWLRGTAPRRRSGGALFAALGLAAIGAVAWIVAGRAEDPLQAAREAVRRGSLEQARASLERAALDRDPARRAEALFRLHDLAVREDPALLDDTTGTIPRILAGERVEPWWTLARLVTRLRDHPTGVARLAEDLTRTHPGEPWPHLLIGLGNRNYLDRGLPALERARELEDPPLLAAIAIARALVRGGDHTRASDAWDEALALVPASATRTRGALLVERADLRVRTKRFDSALADVEEAFALPLAQELRSRALEMRAAVRMARGDRAEAEADAVRAAELAGTPPRDRIERRLLPVQAFQDWLHDPAADAEIAAIHSEVPDHPAARLAWCGVMARGGLVLDTAERDRIILAELEAAGDDIPIGGLVWRAMLRGRGDARAALRDMDLALARGPENSRVFGPRMRALQSLGMWNEARASLDRRIESNPTLVYPRLDRAKTIFLHFPDEHSAALADCDAIWPDADLLDLPEQVELASLVANLGQGERSLELLGRVLAREPDHAGALLERAAVHTLLRRYPEADRDATHCLSLPGLDGASRQRALGFQATARRAR